MHWIPQESTAAVSILLVGGGDGDVREQIRAALSLEEKYFGKIIMFLWKISRI